MCSCCMRFFTILYIFFCWLLKIKHMKYYPLRFLFFFWSKPCLWLYLSSLCVSGQFIFGFKRLSVYFCKTFTGKMCNIFIFLTHVTWLISFVWLLASLCPNSNIHYLFIYCQHRKKLVLFVHIENNINIL